MRVPAAQVDMPGSDNLSCRGVSAPLTGHLCFLHSLLQPQLNERVFLRPIHVDPKRAEFLLDLADRGIAFLTPVAVLLDRFKALSDNPNPSQIVFSEVPFSGAADVIVVEDVTHPPDPRFWGVGILELKRFPPAQQLDDAGLFLSLPPPSI